ncbi:MAG: NAD(P)H-dependent oxidoreductase subunit E, partial [Proteobacteria bacterium]|nr:NAD(P)H-dependent oxidoreductase subunit E [Pseudomonadota bacterium]
INDKEGFVSDAAVREVSAFLDLPLARVEEVLSFYTMYNRKQVGKRHIQVCTNIACFLRGADHLMQCLERRLGIHDGQTTADGRYTLSSVECLAACGTAPVIQVNKTYHENLDEQAVDQLMNRLDKELLDA